MLFDEPRAQRLEPHEITGSDCDYDELLDQFDALIHIDRTRAVEPLEETPGWELGEPPETYPTAL